MINNRFLLSHGFRLLLFVVLFHAASCNWWLSHHLSVNALGASSVTVGHSSGTSGSIGKKERPLRCDSVPDWTKRHRKLCRDSPHLISLILEGTRRGLIECQAQFANHRWNCSAPSPTDSTGSTSGFASLVERGSKESGFIYAIASAGVVHTIAKACSVGTVPNCLCDPRKSGPARDRRGVAFQWSGCSDNVLFASRFTRRFFDAREKRVLSARALVNLHNNRVTMDQDGKSLLISSKHRSQLKSILDNGQRDADMGETSGSLNRRPSSRHKRRRRRPGVMQLVYVESSPDFCRYDIKAGSLGTAGRVCNNSLPDGPTSCQAVCCGRGFDVIHEQVTEKCHCKFVWCCRVDCDQCTRWADVSICKQPGPRTMRLGTANTS